MTIANALSLAALVVFLVGMTPQRTAAYEFRFIEDTGSPRDGLALEPSDAELVIYGQLNEAPHLYRFEVTDGQTFQFRIEDLARAPSAPSVLLVREEQRGVTEVARVWSKHSPWTPVYAWSLGQTVRLGGEYTGTLSAGAYRLEVSNGDNRGVYRLSLNSPGKSALVNVPARITELWHVRSFFGLPIVTLLRTPYYALPLLLVFVVVGYVLYRRVASSYA